MNLAQLEKKLLAAARANAPSDAVPYAFEKRVMARFFEISNLKSEIGAGKENMADPWRSWGVALWRGALACVAVALLCGAWFLSPLNASRPSNEPTSSDLRVDLEHTMIASVDEVETSW